MIRLVRVILALALTLGAILGACVALVQTGLGSAVSTLLGGLIVASLIMPDIGD